LGARHLSATVLLPRRETIVRQVPMRGVESKEMEAAIAFQLDALNPYGEEEVLFGWSALSGGAVLVGLVQRTVVDQYLQLFTEAGIAAGVFTFAAAALYGAIRLGPPPPSAFVALSRSLSSAIEVYGESPARPAFSAEFDLPAERAAALAAAELRLDPGIAPVALESLLPPPRVNPVENDLTRNALPYAAALAGACPHLGPLANLLPPDRRVSNSRAIFIPTAVLAALLLMVAGATLAWSAIEQHQYLKGLEAESARLEPQARRAAALDRQIAHAQSCAKLLVAFRVRTRQDLDALNELTRLLQPPVWTNQIDLARDSVAITGEAEQAAPLLKIVDASPLFQNSQFNGISKVGAAEVFRMRVERRPGK